MALFGAHAARLSGTTRNTVQVGLQYGRTLIRGKLFEANLLATSVTQRNAATCCLRVSNSVHVSSQHGHEVALTFKSKS